MVISENVIIGLLVIWVFVSDLDDGSNVDFIFIFRGGDGVFVINVILGRFKLLLGNEFCVRV